MNGTSSLHEIETGPQASTEGEPLSATVARNTADIVELKQRDVGFATDIAELKKSAATIKGAVAEGVSGVMNSATFKIIERLVLLGLVAYAYNRFGIKLEIPQ